MRNHPGTVPGPSTARLDPDAIEEVIGRFEKSIATANGPLESVDFGGILRGILAEQAADERTISVLVRLSGLPFRIDGDAVARGAVESLNDADVLLWGRATLLEWVDSEEPWTAHAETQPSWKGSDAR